MRKKILIPIFLLSIIFTSTFINSFNMKAETLEIEEENKSPSVLMYFSDRVRLFDELRMNTSFVPLIDVFLFLFGVPSLAYMYLYIYGEKNLELPSDFSYEFQPFVGKLTVTFTFGNYTEYWNYLPYLLVMTSYADEYTISINGTATYISKILLNMTESMKENPPDSEYQCYFSMLIGISLYYALFFALLSYNITPSIFWNIFLFRWNNSIINYTYAPPNSDAISSDVNISEYSEYILFEILTVKNNFIERSVIIAFENATYNMSVFVYLNPLLILNFSGMLSIKLTYTLPQNELLFENNKITIDFLPYSFFYSSSQVQDLKRMGREAIENYSKQWNEFYKYVFATITYNNTTLYLSPRYLPPLSVESSFLLYYYISYDFSTSFNMQFDGYKYYFSHTFSYSLSLHLRQINITGVNTSLLSKISIRINNQKVGFTYTISNNSICITLDRYLKNEKIEITIYLLSHVKLRISDVPKGVLIVKNVETGESTVALVSNYQAEFTITAGRLVITFLTFLARASTEVDAPAGNVRMTLSFPSVLEEERVSKLYFMYLPIVFIELLLPIIRIILVMRKKKISRAF